jgi:hypothetical protein
VKNKLLAQLKSKCGRNLILLVVYNAAEDAYAELNRLSRKNQQRVNKNSTTKELHNVLSHLLILVFSVSYLLVIF